MSGNAAWRALAEKRQSKGGFASRESRNLARAIQALLDQLADKTISGAWLDYTDPRREPTWLPGPGADDGERSDYR